MNRMRECMHRHMQDGCLSTFSKDHLHILHCSMDHNRQVTHEVELHRCEQDWGFFWIGSAESSNLINLPKHKSSALMSEEA
jgi:hypothetical protein